MAETPLNASFYNDSSMSVKAVGHETLYQRKATNVLNATLDTAVTLGTLTTNQTQLDAIGEISRQNGTNFYKFSLNGDSLKLSFVNTTNTAATRVQLLDSKGKIVADSSSLGTAKQQSAFKDVISSNGLSAKAGDYYVKVTFDPSAARAEGQKYFLSLYSGTVFSKSYETTAYSQVKPDQNVPVDNTMTFSTSDARDYTVNNVHLANETALTGNNIGWLSQDKDALSVTSQLTQTVQNEYYNFTLQKGNNLKMAFDNHTDTARARVQLLDSTGTQVIADSDGTSKQKAAYASLTSSSGLSAKPGQYAVKVSYAAGQDKSKSQIYDFKVFSGTSYSALYETTSSTESAGIAVLQGHLANNYQPAAVLAAYMLSMGAYGEVDIMDTLRSIVQSSSSKTV
jgi:hypothetical protein